MTRAQILLEYFLNTSVDAGVIDEDVAAALDLPCNENGEVEVSEELVKEVVAEAREFLRGA